MKRFICLAVFIILIISSAACGGAQGAMTWQEQYDLGLRYLSEGNYEEAIIAFTAAIEIDPKQPDAYLNRAASYIEMGVPELAIADCEVAISIEDTNEVIYINVAELCQSAGRHDLSEEYLRRGLKMTESEEIRDRIYSMTDEFLNITKSSFAEDAVTTEPFLTSSGTELYPFPDEAYGWVESHALDIDGDAQPELISLFSTPDGLSVQLHDVSETDGAVSGTVLGTLRAPGYCDQMDVMLYYSEALEHYCIAVSSVIVGAYTGAQGFEAWLYIIDTDAVRQYQYWDWNNMIYGWDYLDVIQAEMSDVDWPYIENGYLSIYNKASLESCFWLLRTEIEIADGMMPTEFVRYLRFLGPEELAALPNRDE